MALAVALAACSDDTTTTNAAQRQLNSVMVGSATELPAGDSTAVSAIGLELVTLGEPLRQWFDGTGPRDELLRQMRAAVQRIDALLTPARASEVRATFAPYVDAWHDILAALEIDDIAAYDAAVRRIRALDQIRIDRVAAIYGDEEATRLLERER